MSVTITSTGEKGDARGRRRLARMRLAQTAALDLFEARGFDQVTIEEIAAVCDVSAPTIYRHFGTKEQLVFWDEYDPVLFGVLAERLRSLPVLEALRAAILDPLERIYASDAGRILRRVRLAQKEPSLRAARASSMHAFRSALAGSLVAARSCRDAFEAEVLAGAFAVALETAIEHWAAADGAIPLRRFILRALRDLGAFADRAREVPPAKVRERRRRHG
jgi:AcrR family transcriptional regulator